MRSSIITHVTGDGTWESSYGGLMYSYELNLENGDHIKVNAKTEGAFVVGTNLHYELTGKTDRNQTPMAKKINPDFEKPSSHIIKNNAPVMDDRQKSIEIQMSFKAAIEFTIYKEDEIVNVQEYAKFIYDCIQDAKRSY